MRRCCGPLNARHRNNLLQQVVLSINSLLSCYLQADAPAGAHDSHPLMLDGSHAAHGSRENRRHTTHKKRPGPRQKEDIAVA